MIIVQNNIFITYVRKIQRFSNCLIQILILHATKIIL